MEKILGKTYESNIFTVLCNNNNCFYEKDVIEFTRKVGNKFRFTLTAYEYSDKAGKKLKKKYNGNGVIILNEDGSFVLDSVYSNSPKGKSLTQRGLGDFGRNYDSMHIDLTKTELNNKWKAVVCQGTPCFKIKN